MGQVVDLAAVRRKKVVLELIAQEKVLKDHRAEKVQKVLYAIQHEDIEMFKRELENCMNIPLLESLKADNPEGDLP